MFCRLSMLAAAGVASIAFIGPAAQAQPNLTQTCAFRNGPLAGQNINFAGMPGAISVPVGNRCADMQGSNGVAIARPSGVRQWSGQGRFYASPGAPSPGTGPWDASGNLAPGFSQTCRFTTGPRAGQTLDYSHTLGAQPVAIGSACADGPSSGVAVAQGS